VKILLLSLCLLTAVSLAQDGERGRAENVAVLEDKRINESSGLCQSLRDLKVFWTLNDSANDPCLYAFDQDGKTRAKVRVPHAVNFDWEDMATVMGTDDKPLLYIADIGDNLKIRASIQIYQIQEPELPTAAGNEINSAEPKVWHFSYPDGHHNAETLLVHPQTQRLYILTKSEDGLSALYACPEILLEHEPMELEKITDISFPPRQRLGKRPHDACMTVGGSFSPDGSRAVIATYSFIHEWQIAPGQSLKEALAKEAHLINPPLTRQMEAVCYDADGQTLWLTSEHLPTPLIRISR